MDYRDLTSRAKKIEARIKQITDKASVTDKEMDEVNRLTGELNAVEDLAGGLREDELAGMRAAMKAAGMDVAGGSWTGGHSAESADFMAYVKTGQIGNSMTTADPSVGYIVPEPTHAELIEKVRKIDPIFARAHHFDMSGGDTTMMLPMKATHGVAAHATESGARAQQTDPTLTSPTLTCYDIYTDQRITQTALDSIPGMEAQLTAWIYEDLYEQFGVDIAIGTGITSAKGLFAATDVYTPKLSGVANAIANTNFITVLTALHPKHRANAVWLMNSATLAVCSGFSLPEADHTPLVDWSTGAPKIYGREVLECSSAPDIGDGKYPIAFGDLDAAYAIGEHLRAPLFLRDPYTATPLVRAYSVIRNGGAPWNPDALVLLKSDDS